MVIKMNCVRYFYCICIILLISTNAFAQVDLQAGPINSMVHPTVSMPVKVQCDFTWQDNLNISQFTVTEDGVAQDSLTLTCPPLNNRQPLALGMVGDRRSSMPSWAVTKMKSAYKGFVGGFKIWSGVPDKGNVFGEAGPSLSLTSNKPSLNSAIDQLDHNSSFSLTVITNAMNDVLANAAGGTSKQFVITACVDQPVTPTIPEIIALNNSYNAAKNAGMIFHIILVYTNPNIPYINDAVNSLLKQFAISTGGLYFLCGNEQEMQNGYQSLVNFIFTEINPCTLSYTSKTPCPDGSTRQVIVKFTGCNGSASDTLQYTAPNIPANMRPSTFALSADTVAGLGQKQLAVSLTTPIPDYILYPFSITLIFDQTYLQLLSVETAGDLADGFTPKINVIAGGVRIDFTGIPKQVSGSGLLCHLTLGAGDPLTDTFVPISLQSVLFTKGCVKAAVLNNGSMMIIARKPIMTLACQMIDAVKWDSISQSYNPLSFIVSVDVSNIGNREAKNVSATIILPVGLELVSGTPTIKFNPLNLDVGSSNNVQWELRAKERVTSDSLLVCIQVNADNHSQIQCCKKIFVQERGPLLSLTCSVDAINIKNNKYTPMPFTISAEVKNIGGMIAQPLKATISMSAPLSLENGEQATKNISPIALRNNQTGTISWQVKHPDSPNDLTYDVVICVKSPNSEEVCCTTQVHIPPLQAPVLQTTCTAPDSLDYDSIAKDYTPNPFTVSVSTKNVGQLDAQKVRAVIILPPEIILQPASQKDTLDFMPSILQNIPTSPPVTVSWQVKALLQSKRKQIVIKFKVIGENFGDVECEKTILLPKAGNSQLSCSLIVPDSLSIATTGSDYTPNPFLVTCNIKNTGSALSGNVIATIQLPPDLQSQSNISQQVGSGILLSNEQKSVSWSVLAMPLSSPSFENIRVTIEEDSIQVTSCNDSVRVPKLDQLIAVICSGPDTIRFDQTTGLYSPYPFSCNVRVRNSGVIDLQNVQGTIILPPELQLASGNTTIPVASTISPLQSSQVGWSVSVNPQANASYVKVIIRITADGINPIECSKYIFIEGQSAAQILCNLDLPAKISFVDDAYSPNPFLVTVHIKNIGASPVSNISALLITPSDIAIDASDQNLKQVLPAILAAGDSTTVTFNVKVYPHSSSRLDTIKVALLTSQAPDFICEKEIQVDKALRPQFDIQCSSIDSVKYDAVTRRFVPDPFTINVNIKNTGDGTAKNVYGIISLSRGLSLNDAVQKSVFPNTLAPNQSGSILWSVSPIKNFAPHTDSIFISIRSDEFGIVESKCIKIVFIDAVTSPQLEAICTAPDSIVIINGQYSPNQFTAMLTVQNFGNYKSMQTYAAIILPKSFELASGETAVKIVGSGIIDPTKFESAQWLINVKAGGYEELAKICFTITSSNADSSSCCTNVFIKGKKRPEVKLTCSTPTSLQLDSITGSYVPNPFTYSLQVQNIGSDPVDSLIAELILPSGIDFATGEQSQKFVLPISLQPGNVGSASFNLTGRPRNQGDTLMIIARVGNAIINNQYCANKIFIPGNGTEAALFLLCDNKIDTISYFPPTNSAQPASLRVSSSLMNIKTKTIPIVNAEIFLPAGLTLVNGDSPTRTITNLLSGNQNRQSLNWNFTAARPTRDTLVTVHLRVSADGYNAATCDQQIQIIVQYDEPHVFINNDEVVVAGETIDIPIWIDSRSITLRNASINLKYDSKLLSLVSVGLQNDMLQQWQTPSWIDKSGDVQIDLQSIQDYLQSNKVFFVRLKAYDFATDKKLDIVVTPLDLYEGFCNDNSMRVSTSGKSLTITGTCVRPLQASDKYQLFQNIPNPANPSTRIEYELPFDTFVTLNILDMYGRVVATSVNESQLKGKHSINVDAAYLSSGLYFYRLETSAGVLMKKMMVVR